jgi:hypothetical protein
MGRVIGIIVVIVLVIGAILFFTGYFDADVDSTGEFEVPDVDIETTGEFDAPETDIDIEGPDLSVEEEVITVPTLEMEPAGEAEADAELEEELEPQD